MDIITIKQKMNAAIEAGNVDAVKEILDADPSRSNITTVFGTWAHVAAGSGQLDVLELLVSLGADINASGGVAEATPLHDAASEGHIEIVKYLLSQGAVVDVSKPDRNPLFVAIISGHTDVAKILIESGMDVSVKYTGKVMKNMDALAFAKQWGRSDIAQLLGAGKPEPAKKAEPLKALDFDELRKQIVLSARQTFDAVRAAHSDESFYAFTLYAVDDAVVISPSCNSEEACKLLLARENANGEPKSDQLLLGDFRWNPYEWEYEKEHDEFEPVNALINNQGTGFYDHDDPLGFVKYKAGVLASMVLALADLDKEGYFGKGKARDAVTLFCSIPNSEDTVWLEMDSAKRLNPRGVNKMFVEQRIAWINTDGFDLKDFADPEGVYDFYLAYFKRKRT